VHSQSYDQGSGYRRKHYADKEWAQVLELWRAFERAHRVDHAGNVAREHLGHRCIFPDAEVTMGFLMEDYIAHMEHHLKDLKTWL